MKRRMLYGLLVTALGLNLLVGAFVYQNSASAAAADNAYPSLELFSTVLERVRTSYVDGTNLTYQQLVNGALKGMINTLDPHSEFMEAEKFRQLQDDTQGAFGGVGLVIGLRDNFVTVISPMEDTPAFRAGFLSGDRIVKINGKNMEKMSTEDAVKHLRGEPGTDVNVSFLRPSTGVVKDVKLTRAIINLVMAKDINGKKEFPLDEDKIGYVRLVQFSEKTDAELEAALVKLKGQGMKAFILDLRWNPGGLLDQAVEVCQKFLPRGKLVVTTEGRNPAQSSVRNAMGRGDELLDKNGQPLPMVILVNMGSASAAEIVAGCLQDWKRAYIMGEKTFGKGSVQSVLPLGGGAALRLTTAKYYTPSHKVIHEHGITPDSVVPLTDEEEDAIALKRTPGGLEALPEKDRERFRNLRDPQLDRARDLLKGMMLYAELQPVGKADNRTERVAAKQTEALTR